MFDSDKKNQENGGKIEPVTEKTFSAWLRMGLALWPDNSYGELEKEFRALLASPENASYLYMVGQKPIAFVNISLRHDYVEGADASPVAYLEGVYVEAGFRKRGIAAALIGEAEAWAVNQGCRQMGSDTELSNLDSQRFHQSIGFREVNRIVAFIKEISVAR